MNSFSFRKAFSDMGELTDELYRLLNIHGNDNCFDASFAGFFEDQEFMPVDLSKLRTGWTDTSGMGRRKCPRYNIRLDVLICNYHKAFRTKTLDVSLTGLKLKDLLPEEFSNGFFDVMLIDENLGEKTYILFRGRVVPGKFRTRRVVFESLAADSAADLMKLVEGLTPL
jgi:hypothetical protein